MLPPWEEAQDRGKAPAGQAMEEDPALGGGGSPEALAIRNPLGDALQLHGSWWDLGGREVFAGASPAGLNPCCSQPGGREPWPCLSLCKRGGTAAGARQPRPAVAAHASARPSPAVEGTPAGPRRSQGLPGGSSQPRHAARGGVPTSPAARASASARAAQHMCLRRRFSPELHSYSHRPQNACEMTARLAGHCRAAATVPPPALASLGAHFGGAQSHPRGRGGGRRGGAVLTSRAVLPHAALPRLQQRGAGSPLLPGDPQHLPDPRLHTPLAAAGPALVGAGAPLAPGPQLARLCGEGTVTAQHRPCPQGPPAWGAGAAYLGTRGCRAAPRCWGGTAESTGPCANKTCPCTSCRSLC